MDKVISAALGRGKGVFDHRFVIVGDLKRGRKALRL
jgi:hypothetical protein